MITTDDQRFLISTDWSALIHRRSSALISLTPYYARLPDYHLFVLGFSNLLTIDVYRNLYDKCNPCLKFICFTMFVFIIHHFMNYILSTGLMIIRSLHQHVTYRFVLNFYRNYWMFAAFPWTILCSYTFSFRAWFNIKTMSHVKIWSLVYLPHVMMV